MTDPISQEAARALLEALKPFDRMAELTPHTDTRYGEIVMMLWSAKTGTIVLKRADFQAARAAISLASGGE